MRDHVIDLRLADAHSANKSAHREALKRALGEDFISKCETKMTDAQVRCALEANEIASATACMTSSK